MAMVYEVTAKANKGAEILLYDIIGGYDENDEYNGAKRFISEIKDLGDIDNITVRINSAGGSVSDAQAMYSYLKTHKAKVTVRVDGFAASAASLVAMAGDTVIMPENALIMIHNPAVIVAGGADEMRSTAEVLDKVRDAMVSAYAEKTGLDNAKIIELMNNETWMTAKEARDLGFCDIISGELEIAACAVQGGGFTFGTATGSAFINAHMAQGLPDDIKNFAANLDDKTLILNLEAKNKMENEKNIEAKADLDAINAAFERGVKTERERIKALDELIAPGREVIIAKAKYDEPRDARDIALELLKADAAHNALNALAKDAAAVNAVLTPQANIPPNEQQENFINAISKNLNSARGY